MTAPAIDPSQAVRVPRRNAVRAAALTALKLALGAAGLAGVAAGAIWLVTDPAPPPLQSAVRLVKVGAWPEIKDGVPALAASTPAPAPTSRAPELGSSAPLAASAPAPTAVGPSLAERRAEPSAQIGTEQPLPPATPDVSAPAQSAPAQQAAMPIPPEVVTSTEALPQTDLRATVDSADAAPLPPPAPRRAVSDKAKPRKEQKEQAARAPAQRTAAAKAKAAPKVEEAAAPPPPAALAAPSDDRVKIFGVPLPNGRDIKNTFESIGDAMMGRSNRS
jgi:hypothetical protein